MAKQQSAAGERVSVRFNDGEEYDVAGTLYELAVEDDAEVFAEYTCGRLKGKAAGVVKRIGRGALVLYASDARNYRYYEALARVANRFAEIPPLLDAPDGVIVSSRQKDGETYLIAVNAKNSPAELTLDGPLFDVLRQCEISGKVRIDGLDVLLAKKRS